MSFLQPVYVRKDMQGNRETRVLLNTYKTWTYHKYPTETVPHPARPYSSPLTHIQTLSDLCSLLVSSHPHSHSLPLTLTSTHPYFIQTT